MYKEKLIYSIKQWCLHSLIIIQRLPPDQQNDTTVSRVLSVQAEPENNSSFYRLKTRLLSLTDKQ